MATLSMLKTDVRRDSTDWEWVAVMSYVGELGKAPDMPLHLSEEQTKEIYDFIEKHGVEVHKAGHDIAGAPFAGEPWIQVWPSTIVVTQDGGLNV